MDKYIIPVAEYFRKNANAEKDQQKPVMILTI